MYIGKHRFGDNGKVINSEDIYDRASLSPKRSRVEPHSSTCKIYGVAETSIPAGTASSSPHAPYSLTESGLYKTLLCSDGF
jgi:hypothetical protein